jgi:4-azaleucine resistance transporter AzlC
MNMSLKWPTLQGLSAAMPIWVGYIAIGIPFGVLARQANLSIIDIALMSAIVFAGSSQFIAVSMFASGASALPIIITTFFVNLRHLLMSSSLALHVKGTSKPLLSLFAYGVTDESFAVNLTRFSQGQWGMKQALTVNHTANFVWIASTVAGGYLGNLIPQGALGIDFALSAMFLGLLVYQLKGSLILLVSTISGVLSVIFCLMLPGAWYVVLSSTIAATIGVVITRSNANRHKGERKNHVS